jgi:hypothetical protein
MVGQADVITRRCCIPNTSAVRSIAMRKYGKIRKIWKLRQRYPEQNQELVED